MARAKKNPPDRVAQLENSLVAWVVNATTRRVENRAAKIPELLAKATKDFWTLLSSKIIRVYSAPNLEEYTPTWLALSPDYEDDKGNEDFYDYSGKLAGWLGRSRQLKTTFGTPLVNIIDAGNIGRQSTVALKSQKGRRIGYTNGGSRARIEDMKNLLPSAIQVDLYPKVPGRIEDGLWAGDYLPDWIAYRLDNYQGGQDRYILPAYMLWYMKYHISRVLAQGVK